MFKKLLLSFITALVLLVSVSTPYAKAQTWYHQTPYEWYTKVYNDEISSPSQIFGERYTAAQVEWIIYTVTTFPFTMLLGPRLTSCMIGLIPIGQAPTADWNECVVPLFDFLNPLGMNSTKSNSLADTESEQTIINKVFQDRPLSAISYFRNIGRKFHLIPEAEAQTGFGYATALQPFQGFWQMSRDITYGLFIFAAIILAFMIMFRVKLSPQTAITIQSAIPKLIIGLLLVTFSYAIAGLLVDLMYVFIGFLSLLFSQFLNSQFGFEGLTTERLFDFLTTGPELAGLGLGFVGISAMFLVGFAIAFFIGIVGLFNTAGIGVVTFLGIVIGLVFGLILFFVALIVAIIFVLKATWTFIKAFVNIILLTIFSPFMILLGTVYPSVGFTQWLKNMISNLAVFVISGLFVLLAMVFLGASMLSAKTIDESIERVAVAFINLVFGTGTCALGQCDIELSSDPGWPPMVFGSADVALPFIYLAVSFVIFSMIPKAADIVKSVLAGRPTLGSAIGESLGAPRAAGMYGAGKLIERSEGAASIAQRQPPMWTQVGRRITGLRK